MSIPNYSAIHVVHVLLAFSVFTFSKKIKDKTKMQRGANEELISILMPGIYAWLPLILQLKIP